MVITVRLSRIKDRKSNSHFDVVKSQLDKTVMKLDAKSWQKIVLAYIAHQYPRSRLYRVDNTLRKNLKFILTSKKTLLV